MDGNVANGNVANGNVVNGNKSGDASEDRGRQSNRERTGKGYAVFPTQGGECVDNLSTPSSDQGGHEDDTSSQGGTDFEANGEEVESSSGESCEHTLPQNRNIVRKRNMLKALYTSISIKDDVPRVLNGIQFHNEFSMVLHYKIRMLMGRGETAIGVSTLRDLKHQSLDLYGENTPNSKFKDDDHVTEILRDGIEYAYTGVIGGSYKGKYFKQRILESDMEERAELCELLFPGTYISRYIRNAHKYWLEASKSPLKNQYDERFRYQPDATSDEYNTYSGIVKYVMDEFSQNKPGYISLSLFHVIFGTYEIGTVSLGITLQQLLKFYRNVCGYDEFDPRGFSDREYGSWFNTILSEHKKGSEGRLKLHTFARNDIAFIKKKVYVLRHPRPNPKSESEGRNRDGFNVETQEGVRHKKRRGNGKNKGGQKTHKN